LVVRHAQGGLLRYERAQVVRLGKGRFWVATRRKDGSYVGEEGFYYSGKNCWHPKGQDRLVIPTAAVLTACETCEGNSAFLPGLPYSHVTRFV
jgi:hypothetical protein